MMDKRSTTTVVQAMNYAVRTASANGVAVDLQGYNSAIIAVQAHGVTTADGTNTLTFKLQSSPDNSTWTDVAIGDFTGSAVINATGQANTIVGTLGYTPVSTAAVRYIRPVVTVAGTVNAGCSCVAILGDGRVK